MLFAHAFLVRILKVTANACEACQAYCLARARSERVYANHRPSQKLREWSLLLGYFFPAAEIFSVLENSRPYRNFFVPQDLCFLARVLLISGWRKGEVQHETATFNTVFVNGIRLYVGVEALVCEWCSCSEQ